MILRKIVKVVISNLLRTFQLLLLTFSTLLNIVQSIRFLKYAAEQLQTDTRWKKVNSISSTVRLQLYVYLWDWQLSVCTVRHYQLYYDLSWQIPFRVTHPKLCLGAAIFPVPVCHQFNVCWVTAIFHACTTPAGDMYLLLARSVPVESARH